MKLTLMYDFDAGVGLEVSMHENATLVEYREAASTLMNAARIKGWISDVPASPAGIRVTMEEIE